MEIVFLAGLLAGIHVTLRKIIGTAMVNASENICSVMECVQSSVKNVAISCVYVMKKVVAITVLKNTKSAMIGAFNKICHVTRLP